MPVTGGAAHGPDPVPPAGGDHPLLLRRRRLWGVCFALFAFEVGAFLLVFPWLETWTLNHLPSFFLSWSGEFQDVWDDPSFKGAVSGLGLINLYISFRQIASLL